MADPVVSKLTIFAQGITEDQAASGRPVRAWGWSESYYYPGVVADMFQAALQGRGGKIAPGKGLVFARGLLLPKQATVVAIRGVQVSPGLPGPSTLREVLAAGGQDDTDMPQMSLVVAMPGVGVTNVRRQILRSIPDKFVVDGEFTPDPNYEKKLQSFFGTLDGWAFRAKDRNAPKVPVISIDITGLVTCAADHGLAIGNTVQIGKGRTLAYRGAVSGTYTVLTAPTARTLTLTPYALPITITGGYIRKVGVIYPAIDAANITEGRSTVRKVGRPFGAFRGRQSKRGGRQ